MRGAVVLTLVIMVTIASSCVVAGQTPLMDLKNYTALIEDPYLVERVNEFVNMSEAVYSQIVALNETSEAIEVEKIDTELLVEEFRRLKVDLSENQSGKEIENATENVMGEINNSLFSKVEELKTTRAKLEYQRISLEMEQLNLTENLSLVENYTVTLKNRSGLEALYNESVPIVKRKIALSFSISVLVGAILGVTLYRKLRRREDFMGLFTKVKRRALIYLIVVSLIMAMFSLYVIFESWRVFSYF
jgi:hypothetical protein